MLLRAAFAALSVSAVGCSSSESSAPSGQGTAGTGTTTQEVGDQNPYGVAYPTANLGTNARSGSVAGNIMKNFKFRGYKTTPGALITPGSATVEQISLADFFDPELRNKNDAGEPYRILHITVSSVWCGPCNEETKEIVTKVPDLASKGVLFFTALADGPGQGTGATQLDLDGWVKKHKANYPHALDPALKNFGGFFDAAAVPFNADVDLRSMEILYAGVGAPQDIEAHVSKWVKWASQNPAQGQ